MKGFYQSNEICRKWIVNACHVGDVTIIRIEINNGTLKISQLVNFTCFAVQQNSSLLNVYLSPYWWTSLKESSNRNEIWQQ